MTEKEKQETPQEQFEKDTTVEQPQELTIEEQLSDVTDKLQRAQAELINYRKRVDQQQKDMISFAGEKTIKQFLPVLDNFDMALQHTQNAEEFVVGVKMIAKQFREVLTNEGVTSPDLVGKPFDSSIAEAVQVIADEDKEDNTVAQEITKAYMLKNKVIRHARVIVVKNNKEEEEK